MFEDGKRELSERIAILIVVFDEGNGSRHCFFEISLQFAFPDDYHLPAGPVQQLDVLLIVEHVSFEFSSPVFLTRPRSRRSLASLVSVPETAVDEYRRAVFGKKHVRLARIPCIVFPEAESEGEKMLSNHNLDFGVFPSDSAHGPAAFFGGYGVGHVRLAL